MSLDTPIQRRRVLGFMVAGPTLAMAAKVGLDKSRPAGAALPEHSPEAPDFEDFTDIFLATGTPTYYDLLIDIKPDNRVYFEVPRMEVGQGIMTTISMLLADNLDVPLDNIDVALSKAEPRRGAGQITGGSHSTRSLWDPVRVVAAQMKGRLVTAGAERLGVNPRTCRTADGYVIAPNGDKVSYGEVSAAAATITPKVTLAVKDPKEYKIIGAGRVRHNARDLVQGKAPFAMDLPIKGALPTVIAMEKTHGATVVSIDDAEAKKMPGVIAITQIPGMPELLIPGGVAVTAETFGQAKKAKNALKIQWSDGPMDQLSDAQIDDQLGGIIDQVTAPDTGEGLVEGQFRWPYVPHAPMEENDCAADVTADRAEIWGGNKVPISAQRSIARTLGMKEDQVVFHVVPAGGSMGRRLFHDPHVQAAQISQRLGKPVKLQWMREEGIKHGRCRPVSIHNVRATIKGGNVGTFEHRMACAEMDLRHGLGDIISGAVTEYNNAGASQYFFTHSVKLPYKTGLTSLTLKEQLLAKPTAAWRVVYNGQVATINEIMIDELARFMGKDEYEFRREYLDSERHVAVLDKVAQEGQWGRKLPAGVAQGIGMHDEYKSIVAYLVEIDTRGKEPRMTRCTIAVDPAYAINPTGIASNLYGQANDGFSTVFTAGLHVDNGTTRESNFHDYKWGRMFNIAPEMSCHILPQSNATPGGIGELGIPAASGACANAWARATGKKPRNFPLNEFGA